MDNARGTPPIPPMKMRFPLPLARCRSRLQAGFGRRRRGVALVLVLAFLTLITALVIAFFSSVMTDLSGAKSYASGMTARQLADSAVQTAMGQIQLAASGDATVAWASQPGVIRTYDNSGNGLFCYKLYSSDNMTVQASGFDPAGDAVNYNVWSNQPALYTDLNSPVASGTSAVFPIIDGNAMAAASGTISYTAPGVEGFGIDASKVSFNPSVALSATNTPVPMPVKWIYILKDGTLTVPTGVDATGKVATWNGSSKAPSASNPITGRMAFWSDDETCKVNVNTASEGTYADMPRVNTADYGTDDSKLAQRQPVNREYQRYPGHPAMTCLSTVFPGLSGSNEALYAILPRVEGKGSMSATVVTTGSATPAAITTDNDRLFASIDELVFAPTLSSGSRGLNNMDVITPEAMERAKFFLTASSRAPDVNLFNKPRVCIWPISANNSSDYRTTFDKTIAFCSTMRTDLPSPYLYYFQRQDSTSPSVDLPGPSSLAGLGRNRMLMEYLRTLTAQNIPGFGGKFSDKYGDDRHQILTEIFDYIRSTNLCDVQLASDKRYTVTTNANVNIGVGQVVPIEDSNGGVSTRGFGRIPTLMGFTLHFIANADGDDPSSQYDKNGAALSSTSTVIEKKTVDAGCRRLQCMLLPQFFNPAPGSIWCYPNLKWKVDGLSNLKWNNTPIQFPAGSSGVQTLAFTTGAKSGRDNAAYGDQVGLLQCASSNFISTPIDAPKGTDSIFTFDGGDLTFSLYAPDGTTLLQTIKMNIAGSGAAGFPLPTLSSTAVVPVDWQGNQLLPASSYKVINFRYFDGNNGRLQCSSGFNTSVWFTDNDVARSVSASPGDVRLIAAQKITPSPGDTKYPFDVVNSSAWNTGMVKNMHTFFSGNEEPLYGSRGGRLVQGLGYTAYSSSGITTNSLASKGQLSFSAAASIPLNGVSAGKTTQWVSGDLPGDWDNAPEALRDGPFINKPDEGDLYTNPYSWRGRDGMKSLSFTMFTPNRQIPSAVMFGSLPSGVLANRPWQTLLFRPDPSGQHSGNKDRTVNGTSSSGMPADHLWLDLFNMPVVEPYAISEPLSTAGKINMNYQIAPFTYLTRETGIRAVLKSEKVISIADSQVSTYKLSYGATPSIRLAVNTDETLKGFAARFASKDLFRSASEICTLPIVPSGSTYAKCTDTNINSNYWTSTSSGHRLTGDNSRERPYATIYPRLTTKSNTFMVHVRVQALQKSARTQAAVWDDDRDVVAGEYRGSQTVERYVDPNDANIPDFTDSSSGTASLNKYYQMRVVFTRRFSP